MIHVYYTIMYVLAYERVFPNENLTLPLNHLYFSARIRFSVQLIEQTSFYILAVLLVYKYTLFLVYRVGTYV